jgi:hypothetical protein
MICMRDLTDEYKLSVRSAGEVFEAVTAMVSRFRTTGEVQFRGKLTREALVNAVLLHLEALPHAEKVRVLRDGMQRLEAILNDEPLRVSSSEETSRKPREARNAGVDLSALSLRATQRPKPKKDGPSRTSGPSDHPEAPDRPSLDDKPPMYGATNLPLRSGKRKGRRGA